MSKGGVHEDQGGMLDADGHLIERDEELLEYMEAPYKGNNTLLGFPFFPTLDGYHRGAILARLGIHKGYTINAKTCSSSSTAPASRARCSIPPPGLPSA